MSETPAKPKKARVVIGICIGVGLLLAILYKVDLNQVLDALKEASVAFIILALITKLACIPLRILRWNTVLRTSHGQWPKATTRAALIGWFGNFILPFELGSIARIRVCQRHNPFSFSEVLATMALERVIDLLVLISLLSVSAFYAPIPEEAKMGTKISLVAAVILSTGIAWFARKGSVVPEAFRSNPVGRLAHQILEKLAVGFAAAKSMKTIALLSIITMGCWLLESLGMWWMFVAFSLHLDFMVATDP